MGEIGRRKSGNSKETGRNQESCGPGEKAFGPDKITDQKKQDSKGSGDQSGSAVKMILRMPGESLHTSASVGHACEHAYSGNHCQHQQVAGVPHKSRSTDQHKNSQSDQQGFDPALLATQDQQQRSKHRRSNVSGAADDEPNSTTRVGDA